MMHLMSILLSYRELETNLKMCPHFLLFRTNSSLFIFSHLWIDFTCSPAVR